mgnify:FL=1
MTHSGLQPLVLGFPKYPGGHSQRALPFEDVHIALGPHGEGLHGSITCGSSIESDSFHDLKIIFKKFIIIKNFLYTYVSLVWVDIF